MNLSLFSILFLCQKWTFSFWQTFGWVLVYSVSVLAWRSACGCFVSRSFSLAGVFSCEEHLSESDLSEFHLVWRSLLLLGVFIPINIYYAKSTWTLKYRIDVNTLPIKSFDIPTKSLWMIHLLCFLTSSLHTFWTILNELLSSRQQF